MIGIAFVTCMAVVVFALAFQNFVMLRTRAAEKTILLTLKLQGERQLTARAHAKVILYSYSGYSKVIDDVEFAYQQDKTFRGAVPLDATFDYAKPYAIFVKPVNYLGKLFCSETVSGAACTSPQFILSSSGSAVNLGATMILAGDIKPGDGKVDAGDMSRIIAGLGKAGDGTADLNGDGVVDSTDYSLAFYSLSQSAKDDLVDIVGTGPTPTGGLTPTASPTAGLSPTATHVPTPTLSPTPLPTVTLVPSNTPTPTAVPTATPVPPSPTPTVKVPNYSKLADMVANPPQIGCVNGVLAGCPVDQLYNTPLDKGLGWATYYGDEHLSGYNVVADVIHNQKGITVEEARKFIDDTFMAKQSNMTPEEAKKTGKVIAYGATRGPKDLWKIKYAFGIDDPKNPKPYFIGRIMIIDCAAKNDWATNLAKLTYGYKGWTSLNWIVDLSKNGFVQLPSGYSGNKDNTGEGRPGVILIDEGMLDQMIY